MIITLFSIYALVIISLKKPVQLLSSSGFLVSVPGSFSVCLLHSGLPRGHQDADHPGHSHGTVEPFSLSFRGSVRSELLLQGWTLSSASHPQDSNELVMNFKHNHTVSNCSSVIWICEILMR